MTYEHVLVVDDDPLIPAVCKAFFKRRGAHAVHAASGARDGLRILDEHPEIDLILCDLNMPDVDGLQFMRFLMERQHFIPIIIISGEDQTIVRAANTLAMALGLPLIGSIQKPINHVSLEQLLETSAFQPKVDRAVKSNTITVADFHTALRSGHIKAHLQPLIDCSTGAVVSAEALARWSHPEYGDIQPDSFIPILEDAGLIPELTKYILQDALKTIVACAERGHGLRLAINTDAQTLGRLDFPDQIAAIARNAGVPNHDIKLELTERSLIDEGPGTMEVLARLRLLRFDVSIDDFGTGNSNIKQLCTFPLTELKIDKSFLDGVTTDHAKAVCLNAIVSLAKSLRLETVAEGIETERDLALVSEAGITQAQGYYITRPLAPGDFIPWLQDHERAMLRSRNAA